MIAILVSVLVAALGLALALRCLEGWGLRVKLPWAKEGEPARRLPPEAGIFLLAVGTRAVLLLAGVAAVMLRAQGEMSLHAAVERLVQWDGRHYLNLIEQGYGGYVEDGQHLFLVFFPGYVWLTRAFRLIIPSTLAAAMTCSTLCFGGGCVYLYKLGKDLSGEGVGRGAVVLLAAFPFSFFAGLPMTEGLFLLTTAGACWALHKGKWLQFALWGAAAALTRMTGVLVILPALIALVEGEKPFARRPGWWKGVLRRLPAVAAPLLGTAGSLLLNAVVDGDPFAFVKHQEHWYQGSMWIGNVVEYLAGYLGGNLHTANGWAIWLPELALFPLAAALLVLAARRKEFPNSLLVYGFAYLVLNYSLSWLLSAGRYLSCGVPFFLMAALLTEKRPVVRGFLVISEAVLLGVYLTGFVHGAQIM